MLQPLLRLLLLLLLLLSPGCCLSLWFMAQGKHVQTFVVVISFGFESHRLVVYNLLMRPGLGLIMLDRWTDRQANGQIDDVGSYVLATYLPTWS